MIIERLGLKNFLVIHGKQDLIFPDTQSPAITVLIAPNNAGKTTIIRALKFLFYGHATKKQNQKAVNLEEIRKSTTQQTIKSYVEATIVNTGRRYTIRRTIKAARMNEESLHVNVFDDYLELTEHLPIEDRPYEDPILMENVIKQMVPVGLFDFFFFKGEELSERLVDPEHHDSSLYEGLSEILYKDKWDNTVKTLRAAQKSFSQKFKKASGQSQEAKNLQEEKDQLIEANDTFRVALKRVQKEMEKAKKRYDEADENVLNSIPEKNNTVKEKLVQLRRIRKNNEDRINELNKKIRKNIGGSGGIYYLNTAVEEAFEVLDKLQDEKLLPPEISESILNALLREMECICGNPLGKGSDERKRIKELKKRAIAESLSNSLYSLYCKLQDDNIVGYKAVIKREKKNIAVDSKKLDTALEELAAAEEEYRMVEKEYDKNAEASYKKYKKLRDIAFGKYQKARDEVRDIETRLKNIEYDLKRIERKLGSIKNLPDQAKAYQKCERLTNKIIALIENIYADMQKYFSNFLQENVSKLYEEIVTDGSKAFIDKKTLLPAIQRSGITGLAHGGGQQQTLVLAYIMALSELRKSINDRLRKHFSLRMVDDQCFFMDSVFAPMQGEYRQLVASALPGKMNQLVLLLAPQQWDKAVSTSLEGHIDKAYKIVLKTNKKINDQDYKLSFYGDELKLVENVDTQIHAYSQIKELEV
jgi:DNA sulfur modification protein DndD